MNISESAEARNNMVAQCMARLENFAFRAVTKYQMQNDQFVVVCIVVDSQWRPLVDMLGPDIPEAYWQSFRDQGQKPVARAIASNAVCDYVVNILPGLRVSLEEKYPEGTARLIALDDNGGTVYQIKVREDTTTPP